MDGLLLGGSLDAVSYVRGGCHDLPLMRAAISLWPSCGEATGVSASFRMPDKTSLELDARGLEPKGVLYIFYAAISGVGTRG